MMEEEKLGSFNVRQVILNEHPISKPCALFLTNKRIIAASVAGINPWAVAPVLIALAVSFAGLLFRSYLFFLGGIAVAITAGILVVLIDFAIRYRIVRKMRHLNPDGILKASKRNLEISYAEIEKIEVSESSSYSRGNLLVPSFFQERQYVLDFVMKENRHTFILDGGALQPCLDIIRKFVAEKIEIEE